MHCSKHFARLSFLLYVSASSAFAAPAITGASGDANHGATLTLSGSGFGAKALAAPLVFDNFESGTAGGAITGKAPTVAGIRSGWTWNTHTSGADRPLYTSNGQRTGSKLSSQQHFAGSTYNDSLEVIYDRANAGDEIYFTYWYYDNQIATVDSRNHKPWVVYGTDGGIYPTAYVGWGNPDYGDGSLRTSFQDNPMPATSTLWSGNNVSMAVIPGKWVRIEQYLRQSGANIANGAIETTIHIDGKITGVFSKSGIVTRTRAYPWRQWHFGSYYSTRESDTSSAPAEANIRIDDIYFDNTKSRVEIGNAPTWSGCTQREIQVPQTWADGSVKVTVNKAAFPASTALYAYVVDASGAVNANGFPLSSSTAESTAAPLPPANFTLQPL